MAQVGWRWFLFMTGEEGMRQGRNPQSAAAPATVTGKVHPRPLFPQGGGKVGGPLGKP